MKFWALALLAIACAGVAFAIRVSRNAASPEAETSVLHDKAAPRTSVQLVPPETPPASTRKPESSDATSPSAVPKPAPSEQAVWAEHYKDATLGQVIDELKAVQTSIALDISKYFDQEFAAGRYVIEATYTPGQPYQTPDHEAVGGAEINSRRFDKASQQVWRVDMPPEEFPEVYAQQRLLKFLTIKKLDLEALADEEFSRALSEDN